MDVKFRCDCPITSSLDVLGDKWMLVIVKQMLMEGKQTFKDFTESPEAIATNILSSRLKTLEELEIITKSKLPDNKKTNIYRLTDRGLDLSPIIVALAAWSDTHLRDLNPEIPNGASMEQIRKNPNAFSELLVRKYREA